MNILQGLPFNACPAVFFGAHHLLAAQGNFHRHFIEESSVSLLP
jgi:hypothetical protein